MKFTDYILIDAINPKLKATDQQVVIREMVQSLLDAGGIPKENYEEIVKAFIKREELGSTGLGSGFAVPYIKHPSVKQPISAVAISTEGVDFDSLDNEVVHLFVMTLSPIDNPGSELRVMEHLTRRLLKDDTLRESLKQAKTREEIFALFEEDDNKEAMKKR